MIIPRRAPKAVLIVLHEAEHRRGIAACGCEAEEGDVLGHEGGGHHCTGSLAGGARGGEVVLVVFEVAGFVGHPREEDGLFGGSGDGAEGKGGDYWRDGHGCGRAFGGEWGTRAGVRGGRDEEEEGGWVLLPGGEVVCGKGEGRGEEEGEGGEDGEHCGGGDAMCLKLRFAW